MIFGKYVNKCVKAAVLRSVSIKDFRTSRIDIFRGICIPPFCDVFLEKVNFRALAKRMKKCFILTAAVFAMYLE